MLAGHTRPESGRSQWLPSWFGRSRPAMMEGMTATGASDARSTGPATPPAGPAPRRAFRSNDDKLLAGVAGGLADHLGLTGLQVRIGFLALALVGGLGVVIYAGLWIMLPVAGSEPAHPAAPGVESMTRRGFRSPFRPGQRPGSRDAAVGLSLLVLACGAFALAQVAGVGVQTRWFWPILVGCAGLVLLWWQSDESARQAWLSPSFSWKTWVRAGVGLVLVLGAASIAVFQSGVRGQLATGFAAVVLALIGAALVLGPWLLRTTRALRLERAERVRTQERADVAAHLHDSVLQTLALIQTQRRRPAGRRQPGAHPGARAPPLAVRGARRGAGDAARGTARCGRARSRTPSACPSRWSPWAMRRSDEHYAPLVAAAREAMTNAARHSGADRRRRLCRDRRGSRPRCSSGTEAPASTSTTVAARPARRARQDHRPDGAPRRHRDRRVRARRRHRGPDADVGGRVVKRSRREEGA